MGFNSNISFAVLIILFSFQGAFQLFTFVKGWWAKVDSNHRPHDYQSCALTSWAIGPSYRSDSVSYCHCLCGGDEEDRTPDPLLARQVLSQLSYTPKFLLILPKIPAEFLVGLSGLEPPTSRLSGVRSNRLSYKPLNLAASYSPISSPI